MLKKIHNFIDRIKYKFSRECCYDEMEKQGIAVFGMCGGTAGGDCNTDYLSYECIDCPYFVGLEIHREKLMEEMKHEER